VLHAYPLVCSLHQRCSYHKSTSKFLSTTIPAYHVFRSMRHQFKSKRTPSPSLPHVVHLFTLFGSLIRGCRASGSVESTTLSVAPSHSTTNPKSRSTRTRSAVIHITHIPSPAELETQHSHQLHHNPCAPQRISAKYDAMKLVSYVGWLKNLDLMTMMRAVPERSHGTHWRELKSTTE